jgi:hypothetical protein
MLALCNSPASMLISGFHVVVQIYKRGVWKKLRLKKKFKAALYMAISYAKARKIFLGKLADKSASCVLPVLRVMRRWEIGSMVCFLHPRSGHEF